MKYLFRAILRFGFTRRARRSEFWSFFVFLWMAAVAINLISLRLGWTIALPADAELGLPAETFPVLVPVLFVLTVVQRIALYARRLHDVNRTAWWLLFIVPVSIVGEAFGPLGTLLGALPMIVIGFIPGTTGPNKYGEDPIAEERGY